LKNLDPLTSILLQLPAGAENLIGQQGDAWAWAVAGVCFLTMVGTFIWQSRESDKQTEKIASIYRDSQDRTEKYLEATHRSLSDAASAMQEITLTLRALPEPLKAAVEPIASKIDALREDVKETNRKIENIGK